MLKKNYWFPTRRDLTEQELREAVMELVLPGYESPEAMHQYTRDLISRRIEELGIEKCFSEQAPQSEDARNRRVAELQEEIGKATGKESFCYDPFGLKEILDGRRSFGFSGLLLIPGAFNIHSYDGVPFNPNLPDEKYLEIYRRIAGREHDRTRTEPTFEDSVKKECNRILYFYIQALDIPYAPEGKGDCFHLRLVG